MKQSVFIPGPLPGMNEIISAAKGFGGKGIEYARLKKSWTERVWAYARSARIKPVGLPVHIAFRWIELNKQRDPDNIAAAKKFVLDGLVQARVLPNDGWKEIGSWTDSFEVQLKEPGVMVTLID